MDIHLLRFGLNLGASELLQEFLVVVPVVWVGLVHDVFIVNGYETVLLPSKEKAIAIRWSW